MPFTAVVPSAGASDSFLLCHQFCHCMLLMSRHTLPERKGGGRDLSAYLVKGIHLASSPEGKKQTNIQTNKQTNKEPWPPYLWFPSSTPRYNSGPHTLLAIHSPDKLCQCLSLAWHTIPTHGFFWPRHNWPLNLPLASFVVWQPLRPKHTTSLSQPGHTAALALPRHKTGPLWTAAGLPWPYSTNGLV